MKPEIKTWELTLRNQPITIKAAKLGSASSKKTLHTDHPADEPPPKEKPCSACFWTEVQIFLTPPDDPKSRGRYAIYQAGHTSIPGKIPFSRLTYTDSYHEVIELLVTRHANQPPTLTATAARAIAQAAAYDEDLEHAWVSRRTP